MLMLTHSLTDSSAYINELGNLLLLRNTLEYLSNRSVSLFVKVNFE
jgi:hypothetical protein